MNEATLSVRVRVRVSVYVCARVCERRTNDCLGIRSVGSQSPGFKLRGVGAGELSSSRDLAAHTQLRTTKSSPKS